MSERVYATVSLLPQHQALIDNSAISPKIARDRGYRSITDPNEILALGFSQAQARVPGLLTPITDIWGQNGSHTYRPDDPRVDEKGKPRKYENPPGIPLILDVPKVCRTKLQDPTLPLWITESSRKADALVSLGFLAVAVTGVWGWRATNELGGVTTLPDLESIAWKGKDVRRNVVLCFDSDVLTNPIVNLGVRRLGAWIHRRGSKISYAILPHPETGKNGVDDYIHNGATRDDLLNTIETFLPAIIDQNPPEAIIPFPIDVFSGAFRQYVEECATATGVPPEMIAVPLMAAVGGVVGDRVYIHLKNSWQEYGGIYTMIISGPGTLKTASLKHARHPLTMLQFDEKRRHQEAMRDHERKKKEWKDGGKEGDEPEPPKRRDIYTTDSTLEKVAVMMEGAPGLVVCVDELLQWVKGLNQYRQGGDREAYMSMWANTTVKVDRKGSGSVQVDSPVISVSGGLQPHVVSSLAGSPDVLDGWLDRLLPVMPTVPVSTWRRDDDIDPRSRPAITSLFRAIDSIPPVDPGSERDGGLPPGLGIKLSLAADAVWCQWYDENNKLVAEEGGLLGGYYKKLEAYVARFALILHILNNPPKTVELHSREDREHRLSPLKRMITREEMVGAIELAEYFRGQIKEFQSLLNSTAPKTKRKIGLLTRIEAFIRRKGLKGRTVETVDGLCVTTKELLQGLHVTTEEVRNELDTLNDHMEVYTVTVPTKTNPAILYCVEQTQ